MTKKSRKNGYEALKKSAQHGQPEHGRKEYNEDIRAGIHPKTRDVQSPQIRGGFATGTLREFKCRDLGNNCNWGVVAENDEEIVSKAQEHAKITHGRAGFYGDIESGLLPKIRDFKATKSELPGPSEFGPSP